MSGTNIQVNGDVYGGIHVHGQCGCSDSDSAPAPSRTVQMSAYDPAGDALWRVVKVFVVLIVGPLAIIGCAGLGAVALTAALSVLGLDIAWWGVCRAATAAVLLERKAGGSWRRLVLLPKVIRAAKALAQREWPEAEPPELPREILRRLPPTT